MGMSSRPVKREPGKQVDVRCREWHAEQGKLTHRETGSASMAMGSVRSMLVYCSPPRGEWHAD